MTFYDKSIIYKLKHNEDYDDNNIYIGSTSNFKNRKYQHKNKCSNEKSKEYNYYVYQFIRANGNWDNWIMTPIEQYSCNSKKELEIRERHYIDLLKPTLNKYIPTRTLKEYRQDNKEQLAEKLKQYYEDNKEKSKQYREDNKEKIKEKRKQHYENNKEKLLEKGKKYKETNNEKIKQYREDNKEKTKQHYENNKEKILEQAKEKVVCDHCGSEIRKSDIVRHKKTKKCINFVKS